MGWTDIHILGITGEAHDDGSVDAEEGAGDEAGVHDVDVADGLLHVSRRPGLRAGDGNGPLVLRGVLQRDRDGAAIGRGLAGGQGRRCCQRYGGEGQESDGFGGEHF